MEEDKNEEGEQIKAKNAKVQAKDEYLLYKEEYEEVMLKQIKEIENNIENDNRIYEKELEDYFTYVMNLHQETFHNYRNLEEKLVELKCLKDRLNDENDDLFRIINENDEEIKHLRAQIHDYIDINRVDGIQDLYRTSPFEFVTKMSASTDLTNHPKFKKNVRPQIPESLVCLKTDGGKYLKSFCASIYFLELLKRRYKTTTVVDLYYIKRGEKFSKYVDIDAKRDFENHVKVSFFKDDKIENFLISMRIAEKKESYTFADLKEEACDYWGITVLERKKYHIVNEKMVVYAPQMKVYDVHKIALKNNSTTLQYIHMELVKAF